MLVLPDMVRSAFETTVELERQTMLEDLHAKRRATLQQLFLDEIPEQEILREASTLWEVRGGK